MAEKRKYTATAEIRLTDAQVDRIARRVAELLIQHEQETEDLKEPLMTPEEAARYCGYACDTFRRMDVPYVMVGKRKRYSKSGLAKFVRGNGRTSCIS